MMRSRSKFRSENKPAKIRIVRLCILWKRENFLPVIVFS